MAAAAINQLPLIVIVGPTASGKTGLAVRLAQQFNGEIISADSRAVYTGMDIGSAKPTMQERAGVVHWGFDLVEPGQSFSAADFQRYATDKIAEIRARGRVPFLVGGTGLYVDAVVFDYQFADQVDHTQRSALEVLTLDQLHEYCRDRNVTLPENSKNKRYVIRAIERNGTPAGRQSIPIPTTIIVGITTDRDVLRARIADRAEQLFDDGVVEEATRLGEKYGWSSQAMTGNIYPLICQYLKTELTLAEVKAKFTTLDWRLAKRQLTWLRRNEHITWLTLPKAEAHLAHVLANQ